MPYDSFKHHRRSIRLRGYDYTQPGAYFITIVTYGRLHLFGEIIGGVMQMNPCGQIISDFWSAIPTHFPNVQLDEFIVMPNHIHGIIMITDIPDGRKTVGATHRVALNDGITQNDGIVQNDGIIQNGVIPQNDGIAKNNRIAKNDGVTRNDGITRNTGFTKSDRATRWVAPTNARPTLVPNSIGSIVGQYKSGATIQMIRSRVMPAPGIWQRNYHDHIIRDDDELQRIRKYIRDNPLNWETDEENQ